MHFFLFQHPDFQIHIGLALAPQLYDTDGKDQQNQTTFLTVATLNWHVKNVNIDSVLYEIWLIFKNLVGPIKKTMTLKCALKVKFSFTIWLCPKVCIICLYAFSHLGFAKGVIQDGNFKLDTLYIGLCMCHYPSWIITKK